MKTALLKTADAIDRWNPSNWFVPETNDKRLLAILVHNIYTHATEPAEQLAFPHEQLTLAQFERLLTLVQAAGYTFVAPDQLFDHSSLPPRAALLTFDDGYASCLRGLDLMERLRIPGLFFVCPGTLQNNERHWWDVFYFQTRKAGGSQADACRAIHALRKSSPSQIRQTIIRRWGAAALQSGPPTTRLLTTDEIRHLDAHPLLHFGNHTQHHAALPFQAENILQSEIADAQAFFQHNLGSPSRFLAFPNGDHGPTSMQIAAQHGVSICMTIEPKTNTLQARTKTESPMMLGRYMVSGQRDITAQVRNMTLPFSVASSISRLKSHYYP